MKRHIYRIGYAIGEFFMLSILALIPVATVYIDVVIIGNSVGEFSVTEMAQEALLLITILIFLYGAWKHPSKRGFLTLVAGFFTCALIRERDFMFDFIWHGFWIWPALTVVVSTIAYVAWFCRDSVVAPMSRFIATRPYFYILTGLIVLLVLSRTFGSGNIIWQHALEAGYTYTFKSGLQEGLELFGYLYITYGSFVLLSKRFFHRLDTRSVNRLTTAFSGKHKAPLVPRGALAACDAKSVIKKEQENMETTPSHLETYRY